jgi:zinc protease
MTSTYAKNLSAASALTLLLGAVAALAAGCAHKGETTNEKKPARYVETANRTAEKLPLPKFNLKLPYHKDEAEFDFWHIQDPHALTFQLAVDCQIGLRQEPKGKEGVALMTTQVMQRATIRKSRTELIRLIDGASASISTAVDMDDSQFFLSGLASDFSKLAPIVTEIIQEPRMSPDDFKEILDLTTAELVTSTEDPGALSSNTSIYHFFYGSREALPVAGIPPSIKAIQLEDVLEFYGKIRKCPRWNIRLASPWPDHEAVANVKKSFGVLLSSQKTIRRESTVPKTTLGKHVHIIEKSEINESYLIVLRKSVPATHPDYPALVVGTELFGQGMMSRLQQVLREELHLTYGANASLAPVTGYSLFTVQASTHAESTGRVINGIAELWKQMADETPSPTEVHRAQNRFTGEYFFGLQFPASILQSSFSATTLGLPASWPSDMPGRLMKVSERDVQRAWKQHLAPETMFVVAVGPPGIGSQLEDNGWELTLNRAEDYRWEWPSEMRHR